MALVPPPLAFVLLVFSGWVNRNQQAVIDYLLEENRVVPTKNPVLAATVDVAVSQTYHRERCCLCSTRFT
jgi:hypothetical protein